MNALISYFSLFIVSLVLFLQGFFPIRQNYQLNNVELPTSLKDFHFDVNEMYKQEFDRLVFIVIDALRVDFITKENMPFLLSINKNERCTSTVRVETPTVTLPRIKAITTGSIPQFADVVFNLASTEILEDSFLHRAAASGKKVIFYGDDTWIKLYPNIFERYEGVTSFFVNDYIEVDDNVTRNAKKELNREDWDLMILHYLGLDHIGHVFGPYSPLVRPKLQEMDLVIEALYRTSKTWDKNVLIVITGDHGMKDSGGHGGSTFNEIHVPLVIIGVPCLDERVAQIDILSTLSVLMGLKFTTYNIGHVILSMLHKLSLDRLLYALYYNSLFLQAKTIEFKNIFENASSMHYNFLKSNNKSNAFVAQQLYQKYLEKASDNLVETSVKQNDYTLIISLLLLIYCFCCLFSISRWYKYIFVGSTIILHSYFPHYLILISIHFFITSILILYEFKVIITKVIQKFKVKYDLKSFMIVCNLLYLLSLLSSSFIEEEHQVWYFLFGSCITLVCYLTKSKAFLVLFLGLRILRNLNQTGNKWAHLPDFSDWLLLNENYNYNRAFFLIGLILLYASYLLLGIKQKSVLISAATILILIFIFNTKAPQSAVFGKFIWLLIFINLFLGSIHVKCIDNSIMTWTLICALLMRSYNVILLSACIFTSLVMCKYIKTVITISIVHIWIGTMFFFLQGNNNSLSSVDVAVGYVGLKSYIPLVVIMQVICHTYAFPVLSNILMLRSSHLHVGTMLMVTVIFRLSVIILTCVLVLIQRHHLFVWTVFAPKLIVESSHCLVLFVQTILLYFIIFVKNKLYQR